MTLYLGYKAIKYLYPSWDLNTMFYLDITNEALMEDESNFIEPVINPSLKTQGKHHYSSRRLKVHTIIINSD